MISSEPDKVQADPPAIAPADLRVILLADPATLNNYGPVLRRLSVGLIDEVRDLSMLCLGPSKLLQYIPSPPVRVITEKRIYQPAGRPDVATRQITIVSPFFALADRLWPRQRIRRIAEALAPLKPTLLHALSERQAALARRLSKELRIPYCVSLLTLHDHKGYSDRCGGIFPCNSALARQIREQNPLRADRVHLVPIGTHVTEQPCAFSHVQALPHIFCSSPLEVGYGLTALINAIKRLSQLGHFPHLTISGRGSAESEFRRQAWDLGLQNQVHFIDPVEEVIIASDAWKLVLNSVDIFVQPWPASIWRPELLEAMSVGNAVVATAGQESDLVVPGKTALEVPFQDEFALSDTLDKLLRDHEAARALGSAAQDHLRKHFLASRMIARLSQAYREAIAVRVNT